MRRLVGMALMANQLTSGRKGHSSKAFRMMAQSLTVNDRIDVVTLTVFSFGREAFAIVLRSILDPGARCLGVRTVTKNSSMSFWQMAYPMADLRGEPFKTYNLRKQ